MRTFLINNSKGEIQGFEISNTFISSGGIAKCVSRIIGCEIIGTRRWFSFDEVHVRFLFSGKHFIIWEPFGDSSRLWVGPEDGEEISPDIVDELRVKFDDKSRIDFLS